MTPPLLPPLAVLLLAKLTGRPPAAVRHGRADVELLEPASSRGSGRGCGTSPVFGRGVLHELHVTTRRGRLRRLLLALRHAAPSFVCALRGYVRKTTSVHSGVREAPPHLAFSTPNAEVGVRNLCLLAHSRRGARARPSPWFGTPGRCVRPRSAGLGSGEACVFFVNSRARNPDCDVCFPRKVDPWVYSLRRTGHGRTTRSD